MATLASDFSACLIEMTPNGDLFPSCGCKRLQLPAQDLEEISNVRRDCRVVRWSALKDAATLEGVDPSAGNWRIDVRAGGNDQQERDAVLLNWGKGDALPAGGAGWTAARTCRAFDDSHAPTDPYRTPSNQLMRR